MIRVLDWMKLSIRAVLDPHIIFSSAIATFVASVQYTAGFNQKHFYFLLCKGLVFNSFRNNVHFSFRQLHIAIPEIDTKVSF